MKKPTAKQIAARKLFVKRVKAGEFRKGPAKKNPAKKTLKKKTRKNPVKTPGAALNKIIPRKNPAKKAVKTLLYCVDISVSGNVWSPLAQFKSLEAAKQYAKAYSKIKSGIYIRVFKCK